jgi:hypothetical protein
MGLHGLLMTINFCILYADGIRPYRKHTYGPPRPVSKIALVFYM